MFEAELWLIGVALWKCIARAEVVQAHRVTTVGVFSDSQAVIGLKAHLHPGTGQQLARGIDEHARALPTQSIEASILWVLGHSGIPSKEEADCEATNPQQDWRCTVSDWIYTTATNWSRKISKQWSVANVRLAAGKCSNHSRDRLKGKAGRNRSVAVTSVKSLRTWFSWEKSDIALTGMYRQLFGYRQNDKCWWCRSRTLQMQKHLFRHSSEWQDMLQMLWMKVGMFARWNASRCWHVQISELFWIETCDQAVMDFMAATNIRKFRPKLVEVIRQAEPRHNWACFDRHIWIIQVTIPVKPMVEVGNTFRCTMLITISWMTVNFLNSEDIQ